MVSLVGGNTIFLQTWVMNGISPPGIDKSVVVSLKRWLLLLLARILLPPLLLLLLRLLLLSTERVCPNWPLPY